MKASKYVQVLSVAIAIMLISLITLIPNNSVYAQDKLQLGDCIQLGKYNDAPIMWRIIDFDEKGNPLLLTDRIIDLRVFDEASADWETSSLRAWLNSYNQIMTDSDFPCGVAPYSSTKLHDPSGYSKGEGGFLSSKNFSNEETSFMLPVAQKVSVTKNYKGNSIEGNHYMYVDEDPTYAGREKAYQDVYYTNVTDKVFLLNIDQLAEMNRVWGKEMVFTSPTEQCLAHIKTDFVPLKFSCSDWMLRDSMLWETENRWIVVTVNMNEYDNISGSDVNFLPCMGIRPAMYLDGSLISVKSGSGTESGPYTLQIPAEIAKLTSSKVTVNNETKAFTAYNIQGNNYFKLRDIAYVINGTLKNFEVTWDEEKKAINLVTGKAYTSVGGEMAPGGTGNKTAELLTSDIYKDGQKVSLKAYNVNGNNYFKLRDIAKAFDIGVTWNETTSTIGIDTEISYQE